MSIRLGSRIIIPVMAIALGMTAAFCATRLHARQHVATVPAAVLEQLLPAPAGWTQTDVKTDQVVISADCNQSVATALLAQGEMRVKVTLADSGMHPDSLMALAPMVVILPEGSSERIPPATKIERPQRDGMQMAERWDERKNAGEITIVVKGRFVAAAQGTNIESLDTLRAILNVIDFKKLAELK